MSINLGSDTDTEGVFPGEIDQSPRAVNLDRAASLLSEFLTPKTESEQKDQTLVWVDDGEGPIAAILGDEYSRPRFIHRPKQVKRCDVQVGMKVLDKKMLRMYNEAIAFVDKKKARVAAKAGTFEADNAIIKGDGQL